MEKLKYDTFNGCTTHVYTSIIICIEQKLPVKKIHYSYTTIAEAYMIKKKK